MQTMYKCGKCGETFPELPKGVIRCPVCAHKVLFRVREPLTKELKAR